MKKSWAWAPRVKAANTGWSQKDWVTWGARALGVGALVAAGTAAITGFTIWGASENGLEVPGVLALVSGLCAWICAVACEVPKALLWRKHGKATVVGDWYDEFESVSKRRNALVGRVEEDAELVETVWRAVGVERARLAQECASLTRERAHGVFDADGDRARANAVTEKFVELRAVLDEAITTLNLQRATSPGAGEVAQIRQQLAVRRGALDEVKAL